MSQASIRSIVCHSIFFAATLLFVVGCAQQSFRYTVAEPVRLDPADSAKDSPVFYGEAHGFIWSDCMAVSAAAVDQMLERARAKGYEGVADLKWYNHASGQWNKEPNCRTEYGWAAGTLYTIWWPKATKVEVRARGVKAIAEAEKATFYRAKTIGNKEQTNAEMRSANPNDTFVGLGLVSGVVIGASVSAGKFVDANNRWTTSLEAVASFGKPMGCGGHAAGWGTLSLRKERFIGNSFYYGVGPAIQNQHYFSLCSSESVAAPEESRDTGASSYGEGSSSRWEYGLVGADLGVGNEWRTSSGFFGGCEWVGAFVGVEVWKRGKEMNKGRHIPMGVTPRILSCRMGLSF